MVLLSQSENVDYEMCVEIEMGTTKLDRPSWIDCSQAYTISKSLFNNKGSWCAGKLSEEKMVEIDDALQ